MSMVGEIFNEKLDKKDEIIKELINQIRELQEIIHLNKYKSCENCCESKTCKILHFAYKNRLKTEGYAMHKSEFKCIFWHSLF